MYNSVYLQCCAAITTGSCPAACGILVPWPEIKPAFPALEGGFSTTGPPWKPLKQYFFKVTLKTPHGSIRSTFSTWLGVSSSQWWDWQYQGFFSGSAGIEFACDAGDPGLIPGLGRSAEEGIGYLLQHSWASLLAQLVKNQPAMQETWVQSLGWEDPLEKGRATHSRILAWRSPWTV